MLIICGAGYVSGKEIMALELGRGLAQSGQSISFVTSFWNNGDFVDRLRRSELPTHILPIGFISATLTKECLRMTAEQIWRWPGLLWGYFRVLRLHRPEKVIHTNWHHLLLLLPFLRPERDLYWLHELVPDLPQYRCVFRWIEHRIGCFVCVSHAVAGSLRQLGMSDASIRVVHNGLTDPTSSTETPFVPSHHFRIGIVGQVGPWKGHDDLLEAFALVCKRHHEAQLHIFGTGGLGYKSELVRKSIELGVAERIEWHDFVADRREIYPNLDVCVMPSRIKESFGLTALEAGFFSIPVIVTRRGGLPEIIEHEVNGLVVEAERPIQIAYALCRLIEHPSLRRFLATNARQRAIERFGKERFLRDFLTLLGTEDANSASLSYRPV